MSKLDKVVLVSGFKRLLGSFGSHESPADQFTYFQRCVYIGSLPLMFAWHFSITVGSVPALSWLRHWLCLSSLYG